MNNVKHLLTLAAAAVALLGAGASMAQAYGDGESLREQAELRNWKGTKTRAEVRAELLAAQRAGEITYGEGATERALLANFKSTLTRAQVRAETLEARRLGLLDHRGDASEPIVITPAQAEQIRMAGLRAIGAGQIASAHQ